MKNRCDKLYKVITEMASYKLEVHKNKGDWRLREDKTQERLFSGLLCEVGELCSAQLDKKNVLSLYEECGDVLNYLIIILDKFLLLQDIDIEECEDLNIFIEALKNGNKNVRE